MVDLFTNLQLTDSSVHKDVIGTVYQYCLKKFAEQEGELAGELFTPECMMKTLVEVIEPFNGRVYEIIIQRWIQFNDYRRSFPLAE